MHEETMKSMQATRAFWCTEVLDTHIRSIGLSYKGLSAGVLVCTFPR